MLLPRQIVSLHHPASQHNFYIHHSSPHQQQAELTSLVPSVSLMSQVPRLQVVTWSHVHIYLITYTCRTCNMHQTQFLLSDNSNLSEQYQVLHLEEFLIDSPILIEANVNTWRNIFPHTRLTTRMSQNLPSGYTWWYQEKAPSPRT